MSVELENLHKYYNYKKRNENHVLRGISLKISDGEFVAVIGKTGVGKSTLVHILACIDTFENGEYKLNGQSINILSDKQKSRLRNKYIGIVLQEFGLIEGYTVLNNVMTPLFFNVRTTSKLKETIALQALKQVGIEELAFCKVNKISSGQRQRTAIARAIVNSPSLLIADEPTGSLDLETTKEIIQVFRMLNASGITVIIITHDLEIAQMCNRIIEIFDGQIVSDIKVLKYNQKTL